MSFLKPYLTALVLPPASLILMLLLGLWLGRRRKGLGRTLVFSAISLLWLLSTSGAASWIQTYLLRPPPALGLLDLAKLKTELKGQPAMIVVLGGGLTTWSPEYAGPRLNELSMARMAYGLHLSQQLSVPVGFSGGLGWGQPRPADQPGLSEAAVAAETARAEFRIPLAFTETHSRDTAENARHTQQMLHAAGIRHVVVVTHAWHMPRAMQLFKAAWGPEAQVIAAPMGAFPSQDDQPVLRWLPSAEGARNCWRGLREWLGLRLA